MSKNGRILKLPGKITGFLILHISWSWCYSGARSKFEKKTTTGGIIGLIAGIGGLLPFVVHKLVVKKEGVFRIGNIKSHYLSECIAGVATTVLSVYYSRENNLGDTMSQILTQLRAELRGSADAVNEAGAHHYF